MREPGREFHALELVAGGNDTALPPGSDAGPVLDAQAKAAYRERLRELDESLREAESWNDPERASQAREERQLIVAELAGAVGLGGRDRRAASDAERARVNVTRAIHSALGRVAEHNPALGGHFAATLRTGTFCCYGPEPTDDARWDV